MTRILYIRPPETSKSGVRAYSDVVLAALRKYCRDSVEVIDFANTNDLIPDLYAHFDERHLAATIMELCSNGYFGSVDLLMTEIGLSEFVEFFVVMEIKKHLPEIPSLVTIHDPPKTVINLKPGFSRHQDQFVVRVLRKLYNVVRGSHLENRLFRQDHSYIVLSKKAKTDLMLRLGSLNSPRPVYYLPHINYFEADGVGFKKQTPELRIGYFGYISKSKGIDILLQVVNQLKEYLAANRINCTFFIAGGCIGKNNLHYFKELQQYVKRHHLEGMVQFTGFLPTEEIAGFIKKLDIMVLPYRRTTSASASGPMMWARSFGIPVIASRTRNFPELIRHGSDGLLFEPNDMDSLKEAITGLIENPSHVEALGAGARDISKITRWENIANDVRDISSSIFARQKRSIAIDGRVLMNPPAGIANYLINALGELSKQKPEWDFYILTNRDIHPECLDRLPDSDNIFHLKMPFTKIGILWYSTRLFYILKELRPDYFWAPANSLPPSVPEGIKTILTIHDLVAKDFRHTMSTLNRIYNDLYFDHSIRNADIIWSVSRYTKGEIENRYPERKCRDIFVGSGVNRTIFRKIDISHEDRRQTLSKIGVGEKFLLYVGTIEPRKNVDFLLSLMPILAKEGFWLLIVGSKGWGKSGISKIINSHGYPKEKVVFSGFLDTEDLVRIYNCATVFVSTSLNEGFGLPQLEAMNCGCPVVSSHNSAMIEIVHGAGQTVEGWDVADWCAAIRDVADNRERYIQRGFDKIAQFDWQKITSDLIEWM